MHEVALFVHLHNEQVQVMVVFQYFARILHALFKLVLHGYFAGDGFEIIDSASVDLFLYDLALALIVIIDKQW